jgi:hypothetical protein
MRNSPTNFATDISPVSRPLEDCEGCPALAGVRNLRLDDPSADCSDLHCNFGVRSIWARRAAAARTAGSLKRGCTGRTVRRAGACGVRGTRWRSCGDGARSWQATQASGAAALAGRRSRTRTRRAGSHPPRSPLQPALEQRPDPGLTARGLEGGVAHFGRKVPAAPAPSVRGATKSLAPGSR